MGGHSAWRKRVKNGEPAKGSGGAIARHRPHLGRKGRDLALNRKGNIAGGNPKKRKNRREGDLGNMTTATTTTKGKNDEGMGGSTARRRGAFDGPYSVLTATVVVGIAAIQLWLMLGGKIEERNADANDRAETTDRLDPLSAFDD